MRMGCVLLAVAGLGLAGCGGGGGGGSGGSDTVPEAIPAFDPVAQFEPLSDFTRDADAGAYRLSDSRELTGTATMTGTVALATDRDFVDTVAGDVSARVAFDTGRIRGTADNFNRYETVTSTDGVVISATRGLAYDGTLAVTGEIAPNQTFGMQMSGTLSGRASFDGVVRDFTADMDATVVDGTFLTDTRDGARAAASDDVTATAVITPDGEPAFTETFGQGALIIAE